MSFYIEEVTVTGSGKTPSTVIFSKGLNIICGVSNSGKTCALKSIQFAMGVLDRPFNKEKTGYDCVNLKVNTKLGKIKIKRKIGRNIAEVKSDSPGIESDFYDTKYKSQGNTRPVLNELWLKIIGIKELPMIISTQDYKRQRLSWKTVMKLFWIEEHEIENPKSVLLPSSPTQYPYFFSSLLFLLTGESYSDKEEQDKDEISKAKKDAIRQFVNEQINKISDQKSKLEKEISVYEDDNLEEKLLELSKELTLTEEKIKFATKESQSLLTELIRLKKKENDILLTRSQFKSLKSQYISDIKRLTFIVEGEKHTHALHEAEFCPFCDNSIDIKQQETYLEASKYELSRLIHLLKGLKESEKDVQETLNNTKEEIQEIEIEKGKIDNLLKKDLQPKTSFLTNSIQKFKEHIQIEKEISVLKNVSKSWTTEVIKKENSNTTEIEKFKPKDHLPVNFNTSIDDIAFNILEECQYEGLVSAHFNKGTFDIEVNGLVKEENHGKGYWAFLNTVVGLTFREFLNQNAMYNPGIFIVDTPLLGLDQGVEDSAPESMRSALFQYFIDNQSLGQMIVVENTKDLPELDYISRGVNMIEFTHDKYKSKYNSRYGFLEDVLNDYDS
ncbi:hypothetical protein PML95_04335 [Vagococcus lutrae]|uniref:Rad50/SbcC-type AAA domain-containing protein n=1 Tax=Vagococcus lutrae TaxID=81947 RepID=A0AAE9XFX2_9ENTE|nr:hypothetical protein [Vagococcus lutrae]WCG23462.1 hypothetical protein PML95_04335 [Vagococcus lutrae]